MGATRSWSKGGIHDERFLLTMSNVALGPSLSRSCPAVFTNWALQAQYATYAHAYLLDFFVTVENKRLVNPTPKRKVARWNRAGIISEQIRNIAKIIHSRSTPSVCCFSPPSLSLLFPIKSRVGQTT